jgi:hypothetical protein
MKRIVCNNIVKTSLKDIATAVKPPKPLEWNLTVENGQLMKNGIPTNWFDPEAVALSIAKERRAYHDAADKFERDAK